MFPGNALKGIKIGLPVGYSENKILTSPENEVQPAVISTASFCH